MFWAHFHNFCVQKRSCLLWRPGAFWKFSLCKLKKFLGTFSRFLRPKTKVFAVKFRCILEALCLQVLQKKLWAQFLDLCVQKRSGLLLSSDAFWKFSPCQIDKRSWAHFLDLCVQKQSCFLWSSDAFWKFSACEFYRKFWAQFHNCVSNNETVWCEIQMHLGCSPPPRFTEKFLDKF